MIIGTKVTAPLGVAYIDSQATDGSYLVRYSRKDYTAEKWRLIAQGNGPCVYRIYKAEQLREEKHV
jgi:hypothetical protein